MVTILYIKDSFFDCKQQSNCTYLSIDIKMRLVLIIFIVISCLVMVQSGRRFVIRGGKTYSVGSGGRKSTGGGMNVWRGGRGGGRGYGPLGGSSSRAISPQVVPAGLPGRGKKKAVAGTNPSGTGITLVDLTKSSSASTSTSGSGFRKSSSGSSGSVQLLQPGTSKTSQSSPA